MDQEERLIIVSAIGIVDKALISIDKDRTQIKTLSFYQMNLELILSFILQTEEIKITILFQKFQLLKKKGIRLIEGLGDKIQSSSWLLKKKMKINILLYRVRNM